MKIGLKPVINKNTQVLILGSFPGEESLQKQQYYANKRNIFWKVMSDLLQQDLMQEDYETKIKILQKHNIGLWDVIASCSRKGSLDAKIRREKLNDFSRLKSCAPNLKLICFNGKKASKYSDIFYNYELSILLSTSPANASYSYKHKLNNWKSIILKSLEA